MAKYEVSLRRSRTDWLTTVEAGSRRDAVAKVMRDLGRRAFSTEVLKVEVIPEHTEARPAMADHIKRALERDLQEVS